MSVKAMAAVWDMELPRDQKFVLLAYADHADHDGGNIYPAVALVARKTGYSERSIQVITRELADIGRLVPDGVGPHGTRRWRMPLHMAGAESAPPQIGADEAQPGAPRGAVATAPEPSVNHHEPRDSAALRRHPGEYPSVQAFRDITRKWPIKALQAELHASVGTEPGALDLWRRIVRAWVGLGWNPMNLDGMLECFKRGEVPKLGRPGEVPGPAKLTDKEWLERLRAGTLPQEDRFIPASMRAD